MILRSRGYFAVEFILSLMLWTLAFSGMLALARAAILRQRAHNAARLGAFLQSTGRVSETTARDEVLDLLGNGSWQIETGRYLDTAASKFYRLVKTRVRLASKGLPLPIVETVVVQQEEKT